MSPQSAVYSTMPEKDYLIEHFQYLHAEIRHWSINTTKLIDINSIGLGRGRHTCVTTCEDVHTYVTAPIDVVSI